MLVNKSHLEKLSTVIILWKSIFRTNVYQMKRSYITRKFHLKRNIIRERTMTINYDIHNTWKHRKNNFWSNKNKIYNQRVGMRKREKEKRKET